MKLKGEVWREVWRIWGGLSILCLLQRGGKNRRIIKILITNADKEEEDVIFREGKIYVYRARKTKIHFETKAQVSFMSRNKSARPSLIRLSRDRN